MFAGVIATYITYSGRVDAGSAGFTLNLMLTFTGLVLAWVRLYNALEIHGTSLSYYQWLFRLFILVHSQ
jgi:hypothetical protein